jgi:small-conductance mechanosensitive channel
MSFEGTSWLTNFFTLEQATKLVVAIIVFVAAIVVDRIVRGAITRYSKPINLDTHLENGFKLVVRVVIVVVGVVVILHVFGFGVDWLISVSALGAAAIGFASTQTVGNFLAGFYLMMSRPFRVNDYVRIGDVEGEVKEITVNYTKIYTPTFNITDIPNRRVLDSVILNFSDGDIIDYTFQIGFPHNVPHRELVDECLVPAIDKFHEKYKKYLPKRPEFGISKMDRLGREFSIRIHVPERNMDVFYNLQPELLSDIVRRWDTRKNKAS